MSCELCALSTMQQDETWPCTVNLEAHLGCPADHSASRVLGQVVRAEIARLIGEGMRRREAMMASLTL